MPLLKTILNDKIINGGKSKTYIANKLGITEKPIENYMKGKRQPKPGAIVMLSHRSGFTRP